jgi:DNA-binding SARP family transcriptional activator/ActR/RegA family two-component response regulator
MGLKPDILPYILIVQNRDEWAGVYEHLLAREQNGIQSVRTYQEALIALKAYRIRLAIIDMTLDVGDHDHDEDGTHDGLQILVDLERVSPQTRVLIVNGSEQTHSALKNTPGIPKEVAFVRTDELDDQSFTVMVDKMLMDPLEDRKQIASAPISAPVPSKPPAEEWGAPEPLITPPQPEAENTQEHTRKRDSTEELPIVSIPSAPTMRLTALRGGTTPLHTGLLPPVVGSRPGMPRTLIIEGDPEWQARLAEIVETDGHYWRVASTIGEGTERLRLESFHAVILELSKDNEASWQLLETLVTRYPKTKILVISGSASSTEVAKLFMHYPIKGFIDKRSYNDDELVRMIREQFAGHMLRIQTLGDFRVWLDNKLVTDFGHDMAETAIKILLTRRGTKISVDELVECMWAGADPRANYANVGAILSAARVALEPDLPRSSDSKYILREGAGYRFNLHGSVEVDAEKLRTVVNEGRVAEKRGDFDTALKCYNKARDIYRGDYLSTDRGSPWAIAERAALQNLYAEALNWASHLYALRGDLDAAIEIALQSTNVNAYEESTYRRLMRYYACKGDMRSAAAIYRTLARLFSEFFNEEPSRAAEHLLAEITAGREVECTEPEE